MRKLGKLETWHEMLRGCAPAAAFILGVFCADSVLAQNRNLQVQQAAGQGDVRLALLIGNSGYNRNDTLPQLKNPSNDARDIAAALRENGFKSVTVILDANFRTMKEAISKFGEELRTAGPKAVGMFYYAGHGVEHQGVNYLIPLGTNVKSPADLEYEAVKAQQVLSYMEEAGNAVNIVVLDACRDNPFPQLTKFRSSATSGGLAQMNAPSGSFIAFAAAPGQKASDGDGKNGLFTQFFLESLRQPNSNIDEVFTRVNRYVTEKTNKQQVPWKQSSLSNSFFFRPGEVVPSGTIDPVEMMKLEDARRRLEADTLRMQEERQRELAKMEQMRREEQQRFAAEQGRLEQERRANQARYEAEQARLNAQRQQQLREEEQRARRGRVNIQVTP